MSTNDNSDTCLEMQQRATSEYLQVIDDENVQFDVIHQIGGYGYLQIIDNVTIHGDVIHQIDHQIDADGYLQAIDGPNGDTQSQINDVEAMYDEVLDAADERYAHIDDVIISTEQSRVNAPTSANDFYDVLHAYCADTNHSHIHDVSKQSAQRFFKKFV